MKALIWDIIVQQQHATVMMSLKDTCHAKLNFKAQLLEYMRTNKLVK